MWKTFITALYAPTKLANRIRDRKRHALAYLSFLLLLSGIPYLLMVGYVYQQQTEQILTVISDKQLPDFTVNRGVLESSLKSPSRVELNGVPVVFDSTGTYKMKSQVDDGFYMLRDRLVLVDGGKQQLVELKNIPFIRSAIFSKSAMIDFVQDWRWPAFFLVALFLFQLYYLMLVIIVSLLMFIGFGLNMLLQHRLPVSGVWVLACYSVTIPTIACGVINTIGFNAPFTTWTFILYIASCGYVLYLVLREASYRPTIDSTSEASGVI